jgi:hypothetical protein
VSKHLCAALLASVALVAAVPASADAPDFSTDVLQLLPQIVDPGEEAVSTDGREEGLNTCSFPILFYAYRTHDITTFANGDVRIHIDKRIWRQANGHTAYESDVFNVFIDHTDPTNWKVTGQYGQMTLDGKLIWLESGLLSTPPHGEDVPVTDPHPGPLGTFPDLCAILS